MLATWAIILADVEQTDHEHDGQTYFKSSNVTNSPIICDGQNDLYDGKTYLLCDGQTDLVRDNRRKRPIP